MILDPCTRLSDRLAKPELRLGLGLGLPPGGGATSFSPASALFTNGEKGLVWDFSDPTKVFSDAGVTPATIDGSIGRIADLSPNGVHGNQATGASKPAWKTASGKFYGLFDGSDDFLSTASIDFSGTDKITVFAGVRKLSDGATGMLAELSASANGSAGSFYVAAPQNTSERFSVYSRGSVAPGGPVSTALPEFSAPVSVAQTAIVDIGGDKTILRLNGVQIGLSASDQGTGNFGNYPIYLGRRGGVQFPLNGQVFAIVIVGRACSDAEILQTEAWINQRTAAY